MRLSGDYEILNIVKNLYVQNIIIKIIEAKIIRN